MKLKVFDRLLIVAVLLCIPSVAWATQRIQTFQYSRFNFDSQAVELRKADGTVAAAKFLSEIIILKDGRANGGFGILETGPKEALSLYRVTEGRRTGLSFTFKGQRLFPLPALGVTVTFQWPQGTGPDGSVRFIIDLPIPGDVNSLSLTANGTIADGSSSLDLINSDFTFASLDAPPQTVEIATLTDFVIGSFNSAALTFPTVGVIGTLDLTLPGATPAHYYYGPGVYKTMNGGSSWAFMAMADNRLIPGDRIMIMVRPHPDPSEPCRIYDILGTQTPSLKHFEAETLVTSFKIE